MHRVLFSTSGVEALHFNGVRPRQFECRYQLLPTATSRYTSPRPTPATWRFCRRPRCFDMRVLRHVGHRRQHRLLALLARRELQAVCRESSRGWYTMQRCATPMPYRCRQRRHWKSPFYQFIFHRSRNVQIERPKMRFEKMSDAGASHQDASNDALCSRSMSRGEYIGLRSLRDIDAMPLLTFRSQRRRSLPRTMPSAASSTFHATTREIGSRIAVESARFPQ